MKKNILYLGMEIIGRPKDGGDYGQLRNRKMLSSNFDDIYIIEIPKIKLINHFFNLCLNRSFGYTSSFSKVIKIKLMESKSDTVFIDSSVNGGYAKYFKNRGLKTIVFFHNIEYDYYKGKYIVEKSITNWFLKHYIYNQEKQAIKYADKVIVLNERDKKGLKEYYNRDADLVLPLFYETIDKAKLVVNSLDSRYLLFVGGDFFANNEGATWFVKNVAPHVNIEIRIAGGCCNYLNSNIDMSKYNNVKLLGFVDDLDKLYVNASAVVCPIFNGSGMKTKTVEALRFGKTIFGTTEAFEGVDDTARASAANMFVVSGLSTSRRRI